MALAGAAGHKAINKKITQATTSLEGHFERLKLNTELVTPEMVKDAYVTPVSGQQLRNEKRENSVLSDDLDTLIGEYLKFSDKVKDAYADGRVPVPDLRLHLDTQRAELKDEIEAFVKRTQPLFDKKDRQKTLMLTINEFLLNFLQLAFTGNRAYTTLEKWMGRKRRYVEFLAYRYQAQTTRLPYYYGRRRQTMDSY